MIVQARQESDAASREELGSANQIMIAMVKTSKALRIYLPNNPVLIGFVEDLAVKVSAHLDSYGEFNLNVEPYALRYKGVDVYENQDPKESIACCLHADGIRSLHFERGVERDELMALLGIVGFERATSDDDVVTQLWERNLPHIGYLLVDDYAETYLESGPANFGSQQEAISRIYRALSQEPPPPPKMVPKHLLMLTGEEEKWLRTARQVEARRNSLDDVVNILSAILAGAKDAAIFRDFLDIVANLTANMFLAGEIGHALRLVRFLDQLLKLGSTSPEQRRLLRSALSGILCDSTVQILQEALDSGDTVSHEELRELLHILGIPALGGICELLGRVEKLKMRKVIIEVLVDLGRENPAVFEPHLNDPRWYLVRNVVLVLSLLGTPVALEMIVGLISHREVRIRREVLGFLERSGDARAKSYIVKYLRDESSTLRIRALQILGRERLTSALKPILALVSADDFVNRELAEKRAVYQALGELGSDELLPMFRDMLLKKYWFQKGPEMEAILLAVAGVTRMRSDAALALLEEARSQKKSAEARGALEQAISAMTAAQGRKS